MGTIINAINLFRPAPSPVTIEAALEVVRAHGYKVTTPKTTAPKEKIEPFRNDAMPAYRQGMKDWPRISVLFTFADGEKVHAYAMRENGKKAWFLGSAVRAACDKYRYRKTKGDIFAVPVPRIVSVEGCKVDLQALNEASEPYRRKATAMTYIRP